MTSLEIARKFAELQQIADAQNAYTLALEQGGLMPEQELEAASYLFFSEGDYRISFTHFVSLYNQGYFQQEIFDLMTEAFYLPNVEKQRKNFVKNRNALSNYPLFFHWVFPAFETLPILFFPFDNDGFVPFYKAENRFGDYINVNDTIIDRWFFQDLSKPILAEDVYSQYQLEYLNDNVRKSEWVAKDNHIYLHYTDYEEFCAYLQVLNFKKLLNDQKIVVLIEKEIQKYPIDFKKEYDIDYSLYPVRPVGIREVNRLIWHTQLSSHHGGDFFNEIFYGHPNLLALPSILFSRIKEMVEEIKIQLVGEKKFPVAKQVEQLTNPTDKDILVALFLYGAEGIPKPDPAERIVPAIFFQPHFSALNYDVNMADKEGDCTTLYSEQYEEIRRSPLFKGFPYIKTFTPMRRLTTAHASTVRFIVDSPVKNEEEKREDDIVVPDVINAHLLNRSFMVDPWDRLYRDSRLVRFEDGKLNPKATFTALAEFLDLPYTQSMTYCSGPEGLNPESLQGNDRGFSTAAIYRTYPEYANDEERAYLEYFLRDAYAAYGYDFQYYHGEPVDEEWVKDKIAHFTCINHYTLETMTRSIEKQLIGNSMFSVSMDKQKIEGGKEQEALQATMHVLAQKKAKQYLEWMNRGRLEYARALMKGLRFVNREGQPLQMMTPLKLDPELLEQPLYH